MCSSINRSIPGGRRAVVAVTACNKEIGGHPSYYLTRKYVDPVVEVMDCLPLILPPLGEALDVDSLLATVDGILFTGSPSNIEPHHYGEALADPASPADPTRDATTLPLLRAAIDRGVPVMAICRGFQETNVALGGTLHQAVHGVPGLADHREDKQAPLAVQYGPAHKVTAVPGSRLEGIVGRAEWEVNSVHGQGVARLAPALQAEAHAPDGLVEAFGLRDPRGFLLGVQWHPEWQAADNPVSVRLFTAFADACRDYAVRRANAAHADKDG
ncbi:MAG: gamma-glutamyl-gamma-aminobutyrate hydrolase family protein [Rhodocyclaceae bacterium]